MLQSNMNFLFLILKGKDQDLTAENQLTKLLLTSKSQMCFHWIIVNIPGTYVFYVLSDVLFTDCYTTTKDRKYMHIF